MNLERYCIGENYTIIEAANTFERAEHGRTAIVLNDSNKVVGVISQGDLLRALSSGKSLYTRVGDVVKSSFLYLNEKDIASAYKIFKKKDISLLPIINKQNELIDIIQISEIYDYLENR